MRYMVIDTSNVVKGGILHGEDKEFGRKIETEDGKRWQLNSADYGFDKTVMFLRDKMDALGFTPKDMIFVVEGPNSKMLRTSISDTYKANRTGKMPKEQYVEINKAQEMLVQQFRALGARSVTQPGLEADDIIAYLAKTLPSCVIISTDGDLQQCISETAHHFYEGKLDENRYGPFPTRYTTLYKALVGDSSDNIKGAKGFGPKAFLDLYCIWQEEGLDEVTRLIEQNKLEELHENVPQLKSLQKIIDDREGVYLSYALARQYPEKVNTWRRPLEWSAGMVLPANDNTHPKLVEFGMRTKIVHPGNYEATLDWFRKQVKNVAYVSLDIETSACAESDEWQAARKKKSVEDGDIGVDQFGHELTSLALTLGPNDNFSLYFPVDHAAKMSGFGNLTAEQVLEFVKLIPQEKPIVVHNAAFELTVLERTWGDLWRDNGWHGFLPNVHDTQIIGTYVDENDKQGLKHLSSVHLNYTQVTYEEVTQGRKMNQMTAMETVNYGTDDAICTAALYNHFRCLLEIERTWDVYLQVEQDPAYLTALAFNQGTPISLEKLLELERGDKEAYDAAWVTLRQFLMDNGWAGTVCPQAQSAADVTAAFIKQVYFITHDVEMETKVRTPAKLAAIIEAEGNDLLAKAILMALDGDVHYLNRIIETRFRGDPDFNLDSPPQMARLLYDVMKLPVRLRNKVTDSQRAEGREEGNPRTDDLAMQWAVQNDAKPGTPVYAALKAVQTMKIANTRRKMFYEPYRLVQHWKDGLVHASVNQNAAGTRRYTSSGPNLQQLPKHPKATGEPARFREVYVPHHKKAVIVSLDFSGQELRLITDYSQDPNMLACYVGDDLKDMHTLTAAGILKKKALAGRVEQLWTTAGKKGSPDPAFQVLVEEWKAVTYEQFAAYDPQVNPDSPWAKLFKALRALGKKTNFTTEYGAQAPKLAETLLVDEDEAQQYIDAKLAAFPRAEAWKREVVAEYHRTGVATTMLGAVRHLSAALRDGNKWEIGKAERQAVNFKIQGSAAEMTKLAMGRVWRAGLCFRYDARFIAPIHDELVFSVGIADLLPFLRELHALMVAQYASMQVPIVSSISIGLNFGEQTELGEEVQDKAVNDAVYALFPEELKEAA